MKTLKEALFSKRNIPKLKDVQEIIKDGGCIIIHDYNSQERIIIYNTYNNEIFKIFRSSKFNTWDIITDIIYKKFDINEYISNKCDLYIIEGYNDEKQWPKLRGVFFDILGEPLSFRPLEYITGSLKKYNMELQSIQY